MGLFDHEDEEREKRLAAEANAEAAYHESQARIAEAEAAKAAAEATNEYDVQLERMRTEEKNRKRAKLDSMADTGKGDAILDLLHKLDTAEDDTTIKYVVKLINSWKVPSDKKNFDLFAETFNENADYFKKMEGKWAENIAQEQQKGLFSAYALRAMLIEKAKKVARVKLKGKVDESLELIQEVEKAVDKDRKKSNNITIGIVAFFLLLLGIFIILGVTGVFD